MQLLQQSILLKVANSVYIYIHIYIYKTERNYQSITYNYMHLIVIIKKLNVK